MKNDTFCNQDFTVPGRDPQTILLRLYASIVCILKDKIKKVQILL